MDDVRLQLQTLLPSTLRNRPWIHDLSARQHDLPAKQVLFRAGDVPQRLYFVARGWLRGSTALTEYIRPLGTLYLRGSIVGLPWVSLSNYIEDVQTITHVELISLPVKGLHNWLQKDPVLQSHLTNELIQEMIRLRMMNAAIGHMKAPDRLAYFLYLTYKRTQTAHQTRSNTLSLPMTQDEIGRMLGLTNVSVNRAFRALESKGRIITARQTVTFLDRDWFEQRFDFRDRPDLMDQLAGL